MSKWEMLGHLTTPAELAEYVDATLDRLRTDETGDFVALAQFELGHAWGRYDRIRREMDDGTRQLPPPPERPN